jgi:putative ABC transport system ATP-binding protein
MAAPLGLGEGASDEQAAGDLDLVGAQGRWSAMSRVWARRLVVAGSRSQSAAKAATVAARCSHEVRGVGVRSHTCESLLKPRSPPRFDNRGKAGIVGGGETAACMQATGASDAESRPVFRARGLSKVYHLGSVEVHALRGVDLDIYRGELLVVLGPSGSGKSTLLNILGGLDTPTAGSVWFLDHDLGSGGERELTRFRREHVGFVFQFYNLIPSLTARENVALVTEIASAPMDPDDVLRLVHLADRRDHFPAQLSGGEQQRVAIARAVAKRPDVLLCDEPTGALDAQTGRVVLEVLDFVNRTLGTTTAVITHNAAIAAMADRVIHMHSGRIARIVRNTRRAAPAELEW